MYKYKAELIKVVDGDTVDLKVDLGFKTFTEERFRLLGINAPEMRGPEKEKGKAAKRFLQETLGEPGSTVYIETEKRGKYGRWLAAIYIDDTYEFDSYVNQIMVIKGHAVYKDY